MPNKDKPEIPVCEVLGIPYFCGRMGEAIEIALRKMQSHTPFAVFTPGATIAARALKDETLAALLTNADLLLPDGSGCLLAARLCGKRLPARIAGIDFAQALFAAAEPFAPRVFLYGAHVGVAERAAMHLRSRYPGIIFATADGYGEDPYLRISRFSPQIVCVCLGAGVQEAWIARHKTEVGGVLIGLGGSLDVFAGEVKRAPDAWQRMGLEWAYRTWKEPKRISRLLPLPRYFAKCFVAGHCSKRRKEG